VRGACTASWLLLLAAIAANAQQFRGIWADSFGPGFFNRAEVKQLAADCRKYNFNAVFVEMRKRGDAFYMPHSPNTEPRSSLIASNFDALQACNENRL
jgi:uncharacterized lipoprotein YddW (UPF0748 family)